MLTKHITRHYNVPWPDVQDFALAAIHTSPSAAVAEIDHLTDVYDDIVKRWKLRDVIIMGDFNSGCSYVKKSDWEHIRLAVDRRFYWLFTNTMDTTVAQSDCPYDRLVKFAPLVNVQSTRAPLLFSRQYVGLQERSGK